MFLKSFTRRLYVTSSKPVVSKSFFRSYAKQIKLGIAGTAAATVLGFGYCEYVIHTTWTTELDEDQFTRYKISQRVNVDPHHYFLEAKPLSAQKINIWKKLTSNKIWSLEVKQPEIMIVRNYTPLPLKLTVNKADEYRLQIMDIANDDTNEGKLLFYVKNYDNGEVGRWMRNLDVGSRIDLRGPFIEYELNDNTKNVNMYTAGTGVVAALQILLNNTSGDSRNFTWIHTSHDMNELGKLYPMMINLSKSDNINLKLFNNTYSVRDNIDELMKLTPVNNQNATYNKQFMALVCGPDGFIKTVAGVKINLKQGPIDGILKSQGWSNDNVFKL